MIMCPNCGGVLPPPQWARASVLAHIDKCPWPSRCPDCLCLSVTDGICRSGHCVDVNAKLTALCRQWRNEAAKWQHMADGARNQAHPDHAMVSRREYRAEVYESCADALEAAVRDVAGVPGR